jgi:hypothetical protein
MIPFNPKDEQQIGRKRHIGNDVVVLVFVSGKTPFSPISIQSQFNNAFIVVQLVPNDNQSSSSVYLPSLRTHARRETMSDPWCRCRRRATRWR